MSPLTLPSGTRLGSYEILSALGAGGMGEVYRAKDRRLDREVAIKVLPAGVAGDPEHHARFEREAKAVAALSHPNILAIHDFGVDHGVAFAVTELLRGETLRERLKAGALPARKATDTAIQIARGLAAAHDKGFVHRDLKPENIFLLEDGQVKILDFGLAKADGSAAANAASGDQQTVAPTDPGTVMGTVGYMAPEQVRGQSVDARADLFAFGAVLYEMLSGQRAFRRDTPAETMTAILKDDPPDLVATRADLPASLERIVHHCLEKNPAERFQTARDIGFALETLSGSGSARATTATDGAMPRWKQPPFIAVAVVATAVLAALAGWWLHAAPPGEVRKLDLSIDALEGNANDRVPVISPDGRRVLYFAAGKLWVRPLDGLDPVELPDTTDAAYPSWSPDSRAVAYVNKGQLWRIPLDGGKGVALGQVPADMNGSGATCWLPDGRIFLIGSDKTGITAISERGGDLKTIIEIDKKQEIDFHEMSVLPSGGVIFTVHHLVTQHADTIDAFVDGVRKTVLRLQGENLRRPIYSPTGHLLYQRETINPGLWAVKFSLKSLQAEGAPFLVAPKGAWPSLSADGTLALVRPSTALPDLVWVDRSGAVVRITTLPQGLFGGGNRVVSLSPDGKRALITLQSASVSDLWVYEFANGGWTQITHGAGQAVSPLWTPDGTHAILSADFTWRVWNLWRVPISGGAAERLTTSDQFQFAGSVSPDGRTVVFFDSTNGGMIWSLPLDAAGKPGTPGHITTSQTWEEWPSLNPDGHYLAYTSHEGSRPDVYVRAFPSGVDPHRVSSDGGSLPMWSRDGREIVYRNGDRLMSVAVGASNTGLTYSAPRSVATVPHPQGFSDAFEIAADGRFLMTRTTGHDYIALILNWPDELKRIEASGVGR